MRDDVVRRSQVAWINSCPVVSDISDHLSIRVELETHIKITSRDGNRERLIF